MKTYKINPVVKYSPFFDLLYVSSHEFKVGDVVKILFNNRNIFGIVEEVRNLSEAKSEIRKADFKTKKIEDNFHTSLFTEEQLHALVNFSNYYLIPVGELVHFLFGEDVDLRANAFAETFSFKEEKNSVKVEISEFNFEKYTLLTNPHIPRLELLFLCLRFFQKGIVKIHIASSFFGVAEENFLAVTREAIEKKEIKNIQEVIFTENAHSARKFFVNTESEMIELAVLEKMKEMVEKEKIFVFVLSRTYSDRIYCKDCGKDYPCPDCSHPYSLINEEDGRYLFCKSCKHQKKLHEDEYLICKNCSSWALFPFGSGLQRVKVFLEENGFAETAKSKSKNNLKVGSIRELNKFLEKKEKFAMVVVASLGPLTRAPYFDSDEKLLYLLSRLEQVAHELYINKRTGDEIALDNYKKPDAFIEKEFVIRERLELPPFTKVISFIFTNKNKKIIEKIVARDERFKNFITIHKGGKTIYYWIVPLEQNLEIWKPFRELGELVVSNTIITNTVK